MTIDLLSSSGDEDLNLPKKIQNKHQNFSHTQKTVSTFENANQQKRPFRSVFYVCVGSDDCLGLVFVFPWKQTYPDKKNKRKKNFYLRTLLGNDVSVVDSKLFGFRELKFVKWHLIFHNTKTNTHLFDVVAMLFSFKSRTSSLTAIVRNMRSIISWRKITYSKPSDCCLYSLHLLFGEKRDIKHTNY